MRALLQCHRRIDTDTAEVYHMCSFRTPAPSQGTDPLPGPQRA